MAFYTGGKYNRLCPFQCRSLEDDMSKMRTRQMAGSKSRKLARPKTKVAPKRRDQTTDVMRRRDAAFEDAFASEGGRAACPHENVFVENRRNAYRRFLEDTKRLLAKRDVDIDIHFDFISSAGINAAVDRRRRLYLLGINVGTCTRLMDLYASVMSWPEVLPEIGKSGEETPDNFDIAKCLNLKWQPRGVRSLSGSNPNLVPKDKTRLTAASVMTVMALDFLFAHELMHILGGHIDYLHHLHYPMMVGETDNYRLPLTSTLRQSIEIAADTEGVGMIGTYVIERSLLFLDYRNEYDERTFLLMWIFAILLLLHVLDLTGSTIEEYRSADHPHPELRLDFILASLEAHTRIFRSDLQRVVLDCHRAAVANVETILTYFGLTHAHSNKRTDMKGYYKEMIRLQESFGLNLEPMREFAKKRGLDISIASRPFPIQSQSRGDLIQRSRQLVEEAHQLMTEFELRSSNGRDKGNPR